MGINSRLFARYYDRFQARYEALIVPRKQELFAGVTGTVVEIGPGTGSNLRYLPAGSRWIGIEPNRHMHDTLRSRAKEAGIESEIHTAGADGIEVQDAIADVVVSTLVLCSVPDPERTLSEVRRVLRPGGRFLFIEHVAAERGTGLRFLQRIIRPAWYLFGDGCRTDRETGPAIERAGFSSVTIESFRMPTPPVPRWVAPHVTGQATR